MNNIEDIQEEMISTGQKLVDGYHTLQEITDIDVAISPKDLVWQTDLVKLYHYKNPKATCHIPVLVSFALLNRHDVLDLQQDRSLVKKLMEEGLDLYIMDWGYPTKQDRYLTMEDYIDGYLNDAVDFIRKTEKVEKIHAMGICQGGTFFAIYAALYPEKLKTLTTYVAPFDFSTNKCMLYRWTKDLDVDSMVDTLGVIPAKMLNAGFGMLKPSMEISKYFGVMENITDKPKLMNFLRMEKWKNDCPDIAGELFRKYIKDLFRDNLLIQGKFELGGRRVDLKNATMPFLNVYATEDNIIPNESTTAVMDKFGGKDKELYAFPGGHIGVFVGAKSQKELAPKVAEWVIKRSK